MNPINSEYIHFIESQTTVIAEPWYMKVNRWEADSKVEVWRKAWLIAGSDLKELGVNIEDKDLTKFFNLGEDPTLQTFVIEKGNPDGNLVFEAYISSKQ